LYGPPLPFLDAVKLRGEGSIGYVGKKWVALHHLNPDQQGICSATLSDTEVNKTVALK
jgi:hypothetical protein